MAEKLKMVQCPKCGGKGHPEEALRAAEGYPVEMDGPPWEVCGLCEGTAGEVAKEVAETWEELGRPDKCHEATIKAGSVLFKVVVAQPIA